MYQLKLTLYIEVSVGNSFPNETKMKENAFYRNFLILRNQKMSRNQSFFVLLDHKK